ncbi:MAG: DUF11 domain-containing protein [Pirellulales bacterium]|nr:DUF11 domain-containing protein [Pirellulales bacterium]
MQLTLDYLTSYFGLYLKGDQSLWRNIWGPEAFAQGGLPTEANPGVALSADKTSQTLAAGQTATYLITVTNTGPSTNSFSLFVEDHVWSTMLGVQQTPELEPAEQFAFSIQVTVPSNEEAGIRDTVLLSARSDYDQGSRGYLILNTMDAVDFDADGSVDRDDLLAWESGFGILDGATFAQGDADNDRDVDGNDFLAWQRKFGSIASSMPPVTSTIPEPMSYLLMLILAASMALALAVDHD